MSSWKKVDDLKIDLFSERRKRLEALRAQIEASLISYSEIAQQIRKNKKENSDGR